MATQTIFEYGSHRMRLMEFEGGGRKISVVKVAEVDLHVPEATGDEEGLDEADATRLERIEQVLDDGKFRTDPSAMTWPASRSIFREFDLPFTNADQIRKVIRFEAEGHLPVDIDDVVVQHHVLREVRDKAHVLVAAVKKDDLLDVLDVVGETGLDPMMCDIDDFAFFHALVGTGVAEEHERMVVVNAQEHSTTLQFIIDGELFAVRTMRLGTHIAKHGRGEVVEERDQERDVARAHDYVQRLKREIRRTMTTLPDMGELEVVHVTGAGMRVDGLVEALGEVFSAPAAGLDLLERVDHDLSAGDADRFGADIGVMLGMAYKLNGLDLTHTEFRREECAYTKKFDQVKVPLVCLSFLIFLAVSFEALRSFEEANKYRGEYRNLAKAGGDQLRSLVKDNEVADGAWKGEELAKQVPAIHREMRSLVEDLKQQLGRSDRIPRLYSALPPWIEFSKLVKDNEDDLGKFMMTNLTITASEREPTMKISGVVTGFDKVQALYNLLEGHPMSDSVRLPTTNPKGDNTFVFSDLLVNLDLEAARQASLGDVAQRLADARAEAESGGTR